MHVSAIAMGLPLGAAAAPPIDGEYESPFGRVRVQGDGSRSRNDVRGALEWYKEALEIDPDFGDAYYNMACVYALEGQKIMALRYLQIAALNGYATADGIDRDPDLESLRQEPGYRALVRARM